MVMYYFPLAVALVWIFSVTVAQDIEPCQRFSNQLLDARSRTDLENPYDYPARVLVDAETAYQCATSIPISSDEAISVIGFFKKTLSMYSTLGFLKHPPKSYQQPAIDVIARLDEMIEKARQGKYTNFYEYESDLSILGYEAHDTHFRLRNGGTYQFRWYLPHDIVSVSVDGKELPQVYVYSDIMSKAPLMSPIVELEGEPVFSYLENYVKTKSSTGLLEPHAEWNALMHNAAAQFSAWGSRNRTSIYHSEFQGTSSYNGRSLNGKFSNGTTFEWKYMAGSSAVYNLTKLSSGQAYYRNFVSSDKKKEEGETEEDKQMQSLFSKNTTAFSPLASVPFPSYPNDPIVIQSNFSRGGTVSGYLISDNSTAVLSIPSFLSGNYTGGPKEFSTAVADFISISRKAGVRKVVIDVSGNRGGYLFLGYDTFRQFFPRMDPLVLANSRASPELNTIGSILTQIGMGFNESLPGPLNRTLAQDIGAGDLGLHGTLSSKSTAWKSWKEFFGPITFNQDNYTHSWRYDFTSPRIVGQLDFNITGYENNQKEYEQAFDPKDLILLHDGYCGSTCFVFSSLMKNIAGVKSVAVGGIPKNGPMQGVAGTRGCQVRQSPIIEQVSGMIRKGLASDSANHTLEPLRAKLGVTLEEIQALPSTKHSPWKQVATGINTLNCLSTSNLHVPCQFLYEASNCRLFYTMEMIRDVKTLWKAAAKVAGGDTSACVPGSVDGPGSEPNRPLDTSPGFSHSDFWVVTGSNNLLAKDTNSESGKRSVASGLGVSGYLAVSIFAAVWLI